MRQELGKTNNDIQRYFNYLMKKQKQEIIQKENKKTSRVLQLWRKEDTKVIEEALHEQSQTVEIESSEDEFENYIQEVFYQDES